VVVVVMMVMMMRVQESGMRVLSSLMKPAFCVQFSATCGHMAAAAAAPAALSCSKGMPADFVARLSCNFYDMEILRAIFFFQVEN
jgi:hypothetical protein